MKDGAAHASRKREVYIDAFRGFMALVMVQGHVCDMLLSETLRGDPLYRFQALFHGTTAPGFLFASGFVAGLPRAPLSLKASIRRARRLLFVLGVGYYLHLPYFSFWKTLQASAAEKTTLFACNALQAIAVTQLFIILLQWIAKTKWIHVAGVLTLIVIVVSPSVWSSGLSAGLPQWLGAYLDRSAGSFFPLFPYSAFVLAGTVAGAALGRQEARTRRRRALTWGAALMVAGWLLSYPLAGKVDFWGPSPAYMLLRIGGIVLLLRLMEALAESGGKGVRALALLGHETLQAYVLHLVLLYGGAISRSPLQSYVGQLGFVATGAILIAMLPVLYLAAWLWHRFKMHAPHEATLALVFLSTWFLYLFFTKPW
ncbi:MAG: DUF1624 domain-containing protein [Vicinamibacteria bacterium]|nr:DUF1624 domain-containing protein [Vicinamibacteria bacterium]